MAPPPELISDAVAEVLLRLPPDDPAGLLRASVVCKSWLRALTEPAFVRRYRDFHGTPLVLGFLHNPVNRRLARFVPTTAFRPPAAADHRTSVVLDCRHGRALLYDYRSSEFVVWDPVTGRERRMPDDVPDRYTNHVVLCAAGAGCDHSTCSGGAFLMASAGVHVMDLVQAEARLYSSETGVRRGPDGIYLDYNDGQFDEGCPYRLEADRPGVLVGGTLYFVCQSGALLRYGFLGKQSLSLIKPPPGKFHGRGTIVTRAENGGLGLATLGRDVLHLWSTETGFRGGVKWVKMNDIHLQKLMPFKSPALLIGSTEDTNVVFVTSDDHGIFTIELKSLLMKKVCEMGEVDDVFPYVCFYTPAACARGTLPAPVGPQ
ncbi:uncharacterized protein LOC119319031 [Triticum dicoccoides]|uniref:uncharacterized protein LOC119319031 n=1 Tax=Triticum dicoccoides TaxID=85692 RepID=UPI001891EB2F|nr:uncharacterized protein LOC119319031 [Triticum dicoccoides]